MNLGVRMYVENNQRAEQGIEGADNKTKSRRLAIVRGWRRRKETYAGDNLF